MSGPCLCGDPYCGRCFADPQRAECPKCGGPIFRSERPEKTIDYSEYPPLEVEVRMSENIVFTERDGKRVPCQVKYPPICETCGDLIPEGEEYELDECPACRSCWEGAQAAAEARWEAWKEDEALRRDWQEKAMARAEEIHLEEGRERDHEKRNSE